MTLLELLVQELPKRGGWPQWAAAAVQDVYGMTPKLIKFAGEGFKIYHSGRTWCANVQKEWGAKKPLDGNFVVSTLASDHATRIVTREEYEQAVKPTQFEQSVKAANELARALIADAVRQLTDATSVQIGKPEIVEPSVDGGFSAGYTATRDLKQGEAVRSTDVTLLTPLQRIEQLRKARDEAVRAYNDAFVSGEIELRKLKLGDKIILSTDSGRYDGLIVKLVEISQKRDAIDGSVLYECLFVDSKGNDVRIDNLSTVRFAPL